MFILEEIIFTYQGKKYVTIDIDIVGFIPVFNGTRVTGKTLFDYLEESSLDEFLECHPSVSRKPAEEVIEQAAKKFLSEISLRKYFLMNQIQVISV